MLRPVAGFRPPLATRPTTTYADAADQIRQGRGIGYPGAEPDAERGA